jgi:hypothetical protein
MKPIYLLVPGMLYALIGCADEDAPGPEERLVGTWTFDSVAGANRPITAEFPPCYLDNRVVYNAGKEYRIENGELTCPAQSTPVEAGLWRFDSEAFELRFFPDDKQAYSRTVVALGTDTLELRNPQTGEGRIYVKQPE